MSPHGSSRTRAGEGSYSLVSGLYLPVRSRPVADVEAQAHVAFRLRDVEAQAHVAFRLRVVFLKVPFSEELLNYAQIAWSVEGGIGQPLADARQPPHEKAMRLAKKEEAFSCLRRDRFAHKAAAHFPIFLFLAAVIASVLLIPGETVHVGFSVSIERSAGWDTVCYWLTCENGVT